MSVPGVGNNSGTNNTTNTSSTKKSGFDLKPEDFIKMMITQLQNQDPMEPAKNEQLLAQMSQIGQLQSSTQLQESLGKITLQNSLSAAGGMIGKHVTGKDVNGEDLDGIVTSVKVADGEISLELDNGNNMKMSNVLGITGAPTTPATPAAAPAAAA